MRKTESARILIYRDINSHLSCALTLEAGSSEVIEILGSVEEGDFKGDKKRVCDLLSPQTLDFDGTGGETREMELTD